MGAFGAPPTLPPVPATFQHSEDGRGAHAGAAVALLAATQAAQEVTRSLAARVGDLGPLVVRDLADGHALQQLARLHDHYLPHSDLRRIYRSEESRRTGSITGPRPLVTQKPRSCASGHTRSRPRQTSAIPGIRASKRRGPRTCVVGR